MEEAGWRLLAIDDMTRAKTMREHKTMFIVTVTKDGLLL